MSRHQNDRGFVMKNEKSSRRRAEEVIERSKRQGTWWELIRERPRPGGEPGSEPLDHEFVPAETR